MARYGRKPRQCTIETAPMETPSRVATLRRARGRSFEAHSAYTSTSRLPFRARPIPRPWNWMPLVEPNFPPPDGGFEQGPLSNRACGFPAHGLRAVVGGRDEALRSLRVSDGARELVQSEGIEVLRRPSTNLARFQVAPLALDSQALEPPRHVPVDLVELVRRVAGAEVLAPATEHGVELADHIARVRVAP